LKKKEIMQRCWLLLGTNCAEV